ncbi:hypothetical protein [Streptomyces mirabilis]|uniref:hypothetical protein n=1 Tax=Streptomyces mirabilis TaxID=68239 RepID=UPI0036CB724F
MTDNNEFEYLLTPASDEGAGRAAGPVGAPADGVPQRSAVVGGPRGDAARQNEMAGLVLLINTILGGLGTLYATTKSVGITLASALLVLLITVVVLVVKRVVASGGRPERKGDWGGK